MHHVFWSTMQSAEARLVLKDLFHDPSVFEECDVFACLEVNGRIVGATGLSRNPDGDYYAVDPNVNLYNNNKMMRFIRLVAAREKEEGEGEYKLHYRGSVMCV